MTAQIVVVRDLELDDTILTADDQRQRVTGLRLLEQAELELYIVHVDDNWGGVVAAGGDTLVVDR